MAREVKTISETKLGVTLVLSKADCNKLGFEDSTKTTDVLKSVRQKLGL